MGKRTSHLKTLPWDCRLLDITGNVSETHRSFFLVTESSDIMVQLWVVPKINIQM